MYNLKPRVIDAWSGLFLDFLRLAAALTVVYVHAHDQWFPAELHAPTQPGNPAHAAVVIFFVLSGFVIAHTTTSNNRGALQYAQARLSRLYSVLLPALLITALAEILVLNISPDLHQAYSRGPALPRYLLSALFCNEIWFLSAAPPINGPLWSLGFEFWYYMIFGLWFYRKKNWISFAIIAGACFFAGPKILAMMPIWLLGYWAYRLRTPEKPPLFHWLGVTLALSGAALLILVLPVWPVGIGNSALSMAGGFISDWATGILVAVALWLLPTGSKTKSNPGWIKKFRVLADLTFPIYVLHHPLLVLWRALFRFVPGHTVNMYEAILSVLAVSICIGLVLEKQRALWIRFFKKILFETRAIIFSFGVKKIKCKHPMNKPHVVLVFSTQYMQTGGIESHLKEFCLHLKESGALIDLVITHSRMTPETEAFFKTNCRNVFLGKANQASLRLFWLLLTGLRLSARSYAAIYTNGQGESVWSFSKFFLRRRKWVHHHHTSGDAADQASWGSKYKKTLQNASAVIACSTSNALLMQTTLKRDIASIPCFSRQVKIGSAKKHSILRFGYYGRLIPEKGINLLCKLSNDPDMKSVEFHLWGEGQAYPASFFKNFPALHFHGVFNGAEGLSEVITSLDAFLLISTHPEGLPISLLEAMSGGLPWLATDRGGIPDVALDPVSTRIIPAGSDYQTVKQAVLSLANDIYAGKISGSLQKDLYKKQFSSSVLISKWQHVLGISASS